MTRRSAVLIILLVFAIGFATWSSTRPRPVNVVELREADLPDSPDSMPSAQVADPGLTWTPPATWTAEPARPMRLATYRVGGNATVAGAECAVFFFGRGQGGSVDDNVDRWTAQFAGTPNPVRRKLTVNGLDVTRVRIDGTFLAPGADMRSTGQLANWSMLGAIVQGPEGAVFFKLTGPAATVTAGERDFDAMLATLAAMPATLAPSGSR